MYETLGARLSVCRAKRKLRQTDAANGMGLTNTQLSNYETGYREPDIATLIRMATFYGVSVEWLITGKEWDIGELLSRDAVRCFGVELSEELKRDILTYIKVKTTID